MSLREEGIMVCAVPASGAGREAGTWFWWGESS